MGTDVVHRLGDRELSPSQLSAAVLSTLIRDAEAALGMHVSEAVLTVPAYFGDAQRKATRDAAAICGLRVGRILNEPTAAAMAYGLHERDRELTAAVLDLGGGTFDVSILEVIEGVIEIQSSSGDSHLGGDDFDQVLAAELARRIAAVHGADPRDDAVGHARVHAAAIEAKERLSTYDTAQVVLPRLPLASRETDVSVTVTRADAEEGWGRLLARMRAPIANALRDAGIRASQVDEVLLVGGATRMPCVVRLAAQLFGRMPSRALPADEAVVLGAAVQAALKSGDQAVGDLIVTDVAPFTMGIETMVQLGRQHVPGVFTPVLERGTVIPASRLKTFTTVRDYQSQIEIEVYQGEHSLCRDNTKLGAYTVRGIPRAPAGQEAVSVRFTYDLNGLLEVETTIQSTGRTEHLLVERSPGQLSPEQVAKAQDEMRQLKHHPREMLPNTTALARAEALYVELTGSARAKLGHTIAMLRAALECQETVLIDQCRESLNATLAELGRRA